MEFLSFKIENYFKQPYVTLKLLCIKKKLLDT